MTDDSDTQNTDGSPEGKSLEAEVGDPGPPNPHEEFESDESTPLDDVDWWRSWLGIAFIAIGLLGALGLLYKVILELPPLQPIKKIGELSSAQTYYALGVLAGHGLVTGSVLAICFKLLTAAERLLVPITDASKIPAATGQSDGSTSKDEEHSSSDANKLPPGDTDKHELMQLIAEKLTTG